MKAYFIDEIHEDNFNKTTAHWGSYCHNGNEEYLAACYILAAPMIFDKVKNMWEGFDYPTDWAWSADEGQLDLSGGQIRLGLLARHLFNSSYVEFNLVDCIWSLDQEHYKAMMTAIHIRRSGLSILS